MVIFILYLRVFRLLLLRLRLEPPVIDQVLGDKKLNLGLDAFAARGAVVFGAGASSGAGKLDVVLGRGAV